MFRILRKMTGKVVARNVPEESLESHLSALPPGVYGIEDSGGNEVSIATVKCGKLAWGRVAIATVK